MTIFEVNFETDFAVIGPERRDKFFTHLDYIPKPGQWIYVEKQSVDIDRFLAQVTGVSVEQIDTDLFKCHVVINKRSLKEDILFAKLSRRTFDLLDLDKELLEPLNLTDTSAKSESFVIETRTNLPSYSNANYSNNEVSNQ